jgi:hypothetical protein
MPAPSQLAIATSSLQRLFKEQASYHKELASQRERLARLESSTVEDEMGNRDFEIKQQVCYIPLHPSTPKDMDFCDCLDNISLE